jgi:chromate transporter
MLAPAATVEQSYSLGRLVAYFLRLGSLGFGGPVALVGYMQRDLVDRRRWIEQIDYDEGLALAQLAPGPLAAQLAFYLGWVRARLLGAALVSVAFVAPSFVMVLVLSVLYVRFGGLPWMRGAFYGIGAAVTAIIARSVVLLAKKTLKGDRLFWSIAIVNAAATAITESEIIWLIVGGGFVTTAIRTRAKAIPLLGIPLPAIWVTGLYGPATLATLGKIFWFFIMAGLLVFGSGLAIVPFLHGGVVVKNGWLTERQFLDAVAVAMITPGPVVITVAFIGYLVAGLAGATLAAVGVFVPCLVIVLVAAPHFRRLAANARIKSFVSGVTAGAVGAIAGASIVIAHKSLVDVPTMLVAGATVGALAVSKRLPEPLIIAAAGALGIGMGGPLP